MAYFGYPAYYKKFKCLADKCKNTCCQKWEIDIDRATAEKYRHEKSTLGKDLRAFTYTDRDGRHIKFNEKGFCPLLTDNGLCRIVLEKGEGYLCDICRLHPRFFNWYSAGKEGGVGLCCEAAARLILNCDDFTVYTENFTDTENELEYENDGEIENFVLEKRKILLSLAQKQRDENGSEEELFDTCLALAKPFFDEYTDYVFYIDEEVFENNKNAGEFKNIFKPENIKRLCEFCLKLEIENPEWEKLLKDIHSKAEEISRQREEVLKKYPRLKNKIISLFAYFIYRHFPGVYYDDGIYAKTNFRVLSRGFIEIIFIFNRAKNQTLTREDTIRLSSLYSREIEYDTDNVTGLEKLNIFI